VIFLSVPRFKSLLLFFLNGKTRVWEEIIIIGVLLKTPFHWRPPWTSRRRPPDSRRKPLYFHSL